MESPTEAAKAKTPSTQRRLLLEIEKIKEIKVEILDNDEMRQELRIDTKSHLESQTP